MSDAGNRLSTSKQRSRAPGFGEAAQLPSSNPFSLRVETPGHYRARAAPALELRHRGRWADSNTAAPGGSRASSLVLPVLTEATANRTPLAVPPPLRGQPSRTYVPASNGG
jgi:hypothetical protein